MNSKTFLPVVAAVSSLAAADCTRFADVDRAAQNQWAAQNYERGAAAMIVVGATNDAVRAVNECKRLLYESGTVAFQHEGAYGSFAAHNLEAGTCGIGEGSALRADDNHERTEEQLTVRTSRLGDAQVTVLQGTENVVGGQVQYEQIAVANGLQENTFGRAEERIHGAYQERCFAGSVNTAYDPTAVNPLVMQPVEAYEVPCATVEEALRQVMDDLWALKQVGVDVAKKTRGFTE